MKNILLIALIILLVSCGKEDIRPYDKAFIHIMENNTSTATVHYQANVIREYTVYLSSKPLTENLTVKYEIIAGKGLQENVDFEILTKGNSLLFLPGIYDMPVRIRWMESTSFDAGADNTLTIRLLSNDQNLIMGLPGPDQRQKQFVITKVK